MSSRAARLSRPARVRISSNQGARADRETIRPQYDRFQPRLVRIDGDARQPRVQIGDHRLAALRLAQHGGEVADLTAHAGQRLRRADLNQGRADLLQQSDRRRLGERADQDEIGIIGQRLLGVAVVGWQSRGQRRHVAAARVLRQPGDRLDDVESASRSANSSAHWLSETIRCGLARAGAARSAAQSPADGMARALRRPRPLRGKASWHQRRTRLAARPLIRHASRDTFPHKGGRRTRPLTSYRKSRHSMSVPRRRSCTLPRSARRSVFDPAEQREIVVELVVGEDV